jgi:hypothetical protein
MNPVPSIEFAIDTALRALCAGDPTLTGISISAAMATPDSGLPAIIHATTTRPLIASNHTHEAAVAIGVLTSTEDDETTHERARAIATRLAALVLSPGFEGAFAAAASAAPQPFVPLPGSFRPGDAAEVQPEGSAVWHQGMQVQFVAQF